MPEPQRSLFLYRPKSEIERHRRIKLAVWAYAYEDMSDSIVDDFTFDREALLVDTSINTGNPEMDKFFREEFHAHSGQWIHKHPQIDGIIAIYQHHHEHNRSKY